jgi:hypothetical protein
MSLQQSSTSATPIIPYDGFHDASSEIQILVGQLKARDTKIVELEREAVLLRDEKTALQLEVRPSQLESPLISYIVLVSSKYLHTNKACQTRSSELF